MLNPIEPTVIKTVAELSRWSDGVRSIGRRIALVPTMGALHEGHLSLVRLAYRHADRVVVSIFVNPTQFGPAEDFARYPRDLAKDVEALRKVGVDVVFAPGVEEMYPGGDATWVEVERLTSGLCGRSRPGHFRGVTTVVARLFNAARPHLAVFGEKDYQQLAVIRRMARDLAFGIEVLGGPIVREPDGLAMSSRNVFLSPRARQQAAALPAALHEARALVRAGVRDATVLCHETRRRIEKEPLAEIDYVEIVDAESLEPQRELRAPAVLALAVRFEGTRLIDNTLLVAESP
ncbi:MAG TPA: pantoate--beta-alanine ligase [Myxococcota bacterium]|nr:pantoate--beta-alanine ligase [Myxococcota bacterium]